MRTVGLIPGGASCGSGLLDNVNVLGFHNYNGAFGAVSGWLHDSILKSVVFYPLLQVTYRAYKRVPTRTLLHYQSFSLALEAGLIWIIVKSSLRCAATICND
jgi:hypothetical protein